MQFAPSEALSLGLELELQIVDPSTGQLSASAPRLCQQLQETPQGRHYALEATRSTIEMNSSVQHDAQALRTEMHALVGQLQDVASAEGLAVRGGGTHVAQFWNERILTATDRAHVLDRRFGFLPKRFSTYGMHVHVGMPDGETALRVANVLQAHTPLFIAMAAASPFLQHGDSGFAACRPLEPLVYPHGGPMPHLFDWAHFESLVHELCATGIAETLKDIYWDVRPKPEFGTVEVRVFDTPLSVDKAVNLAAFTRAIAALALAGTLKLPQPRRHVTEGKVSRFLACRDGLQARLFDPVRADWVTGRDWALDLCARIAAERPTPTDQAALQALADGLAGEEDHARMRALWIGLSPSGELPSGGAPDTETLAAYSAAVCKQLRG
ncbi:YbdK family carboxylate-amine ligase [Roseateles asaccharophilus]|uniref:Putative glutamate--cysteine ligase 2 n=1 Tax=Roseateles asaccharophilus TaxID=582607 RepID=A0ABU2A950_9BURK|nr:YbdK family carboxylate-amine ligase [Roseateles asaccharophilus]MDR7333735.1 carboxylate-amine ligase [Roseateles asaccharophilus]